MTRAQQSELKDIADTLARRSNDAAAMQRFSALVRTLGAGDRRDLVAVLQDMIDEARERRAFTHGGYER